MTILHYGTLGYFRSSTNCKNFSPINTREENDSPTQSINKAGKVFAHIVHFVFVNISNISKLTKVDMLHAEKSHLSHGYVIMKLYHPTDEPSLK